MSNRTIGLVAALAVVTGSAGVSTTRAQSPDERVRLAADQARDSAERARQRVRAPERRGSQLGIMVADVTEASPNAGPSVVVETVDSQSSAEKAGLRQGDLIAEYDGERVRSARQFSRLVQETVEGRAVALTFRRGGERQTVTVTPEARSVSWNFDVDIDADRLHQDIQRRLRDLPDFAAIGPDGSAFNMGGLTPRSVTPRRRLGVQLDELTPQLAEYFGAPEGGVLVTTVTEGSAAARAGLKAGDVITSIEGAPVRNYAALASELRDVEGTEVTIGLVRDRKASAVKATLEDAGRGQERRSFRARRPA